MKEQVPPGAGVDNLSASQPQMPGHLTEQQAYYTVADRSRSVRNMTIVIAVLFAFGLIGLFFMIKKSVIPQAAVATQTVTDEAKIEVAIERLTGVSTEMMDRMDQIVNKFYEFSDVLQVRVGELVKNPFELESFVSSLSDSDALESDPTDALKVMQQKLMHKAEELKLQSIIQSERGHRCMINDQILYVNDRVKDFRIVSITEYGVILQWENPEGDGQETESQHCQIELKLSE